MACALRCRFLIFVHCTNACYQARPKRSAGFPSNLVAWRDGSLWMAGRCDLSESFNGRRLRARRGGYGHAARTVWLRDMFGATPSDAKWNTPFLRFWFPPFGLNLVGSCVSGEAVGRGKPHATAEEEPPGRCEVLAPLALRLTREHHQMLSLVLCLRNLRVALRLRRRCCCFKLLSWLPRSAA